MSEIGILRQQSSYFPVTPATPNAGCPIAAEIGLPLATSACHTCHGHPSRPTPPAHAYTRASTEGGNKREERTVGAFGNSCCSSGMQRVPRHEVVPAEPS